MKTQRIMFSLAILLGLLLGACTEDTPTNPGFGQANRWDFKLIEATDNGDGTWHYKWESPPWDSEIDGYDQGVGWLIEGEKDIRPIKPTDNGYYILEGNFINKNVFVKGIGQWRLNDEKQYEFASRTETAKAAAQHSDYYLERNDQWNFGFTFQNGNIHPVKMDNLSGLEAIITAPNSAVINETIKFSGSESKLENYPGAKIKTYNWNFGDGHTGNGQIFEHRYAQAGNYTVELTVTDDRGVSDRAWHDIRIGEYKFPENAMKGSGKYVRFVYDRQRNIITFYFYLDICTYYGNGVPFAWFWGPDVPGGHYFTALEIVQYNGRWGKCELPYKELMILVYNYGQGYSEYDGVTHANWDHLSLSRFFVNPDLQTLIISGDEASKP